jgi:hypothetical protein
MYFATFSSQLIRGLFNHIMLDNGTYLDMLFLITSCKILGVCSEFIFLGFKTMHLGTLCCILSQKCYISTVERNIPKAELILASGKI